MSSLTNIADNNSIDINRLVVFLNTNGVTITDPNLELGTENTQTIETIVFNSLNILKSTENFQQFKTSISLEKSFNKLLKKKSKNSKTTFAVVIVATLISILSFFYMLGSDSVDKTDVSNINTNDTTNAYDSNDVNGLTPATSLPPEINTSHEMTQTTCISTTRKTKPLVTKSDIIYITKKISFEWSYKSSIWTYSTTIPGEVYSMYKSIERNNTNNNYSRYVTDTKDDKWIGNLVETFSKKALESGYSDYEVVCLIINFVQSLDYVKDKVSTGYDEYPKFPLETLYDQGGDCEDTSILLASLIRELGYGTVLIVFDNHAGIGVQGESGAQGSYFEYNGTPFYYVETTGEGWNIGDIPDEIQNKNANVTLYFKQLNIR